MKYDFDVLFLDVTSPKYYDYHTLEKQPLGGTEASIIRIAEGIAGFGLKVAVAIGQVPYFEPMISKYAFYFHTDDLSKITCKHYVQLRGVKNSHLFPKAKKYVWLHDAADDRMKEWNTQVNENKITVIAVSKYHKKEIQKHLVTSNVEYIYNPVPDEIYLPEDVELNYNPNNMIWAASPHKGLGKALEVFKRVKERLPKANLVVANPGYFSVDAVAIQNMPGVSMLGAVPCRQLWAALQSSLCVFYPSQYPETFCCNLAESNAIGVPMLGYEHGVLKEVVSTDDQLVQDGNEDALVDRVVEWSTKSRPKVRGQDLFKLSRVVFQWIQLLAGKQ